MASSPEIVVVGSHAPGILIRVKRPPIAGETVMGWDYEEPVDGGKGSNQAIAAAKLGAKVSFVGCVGDDRLGREGESWMRAAGVDLTHLRRSQTAATAGGIVILDETGIPAIVSGIGANGEFSESDVDRALEALTGAAVLLTQFEIRPEVALYAARRGKQKGMVTIVNPAPAAEASLEGLSAVDVLTPNESEAKSLLGLNPAVEASAEELAQRLRAETGAACVVITVGERGATAADAAGVWEAPAPAVQAVDTTGAGDAFNAALAVEMARDKTAREAVGWACQVAALSVTRPGTIPTYPTAQEVADFIRDHG